MATVVPPEEETRKAAEAFEVWCAFRQAEAERPSLMRNPYYMALRGEVYADMMIEFERL